MKKILLLLGIILLLSSCFGDNNKEQVESIKKVYDSKNFTIDYPSKWKVLKNTDEILPKPSNGDILFDAVSEKKVDGFYRNLLVIKQKIKQNSMNSLDFIIGNYLGSKKEYFYNKDLGYKNVKIDGKKTRIYEFEAKYSEDTPIVKFLQTGVICDDDGYIITIAIEESNKNIERYEGLLGSFTCKNNDLNKIKF